MSYYNKTNWQNNVTPVSQTNMNNIENGIYNSYFDRVRQQQVIDQLSNIVSDPANIKRLIFFDETGAVANVKDRCNNGDAYLSANASSLSPDIEGNAKTLLFPSQTKWEIDPWIEYNATSGLLPNDASQRYVWTGTSSGTSTKTFSDNKLIITVTTASGNVRYSRYPLINSKKTFITELKAVFNGGSSDSAFYMDWKDGVKNGSVIIYKDGTLKSYTTGSPAYQTIATGLNVTSDFVLKLTCNKVDGIKYYFNGNLIGTTPYDSIGNSATLSQAFYFQVYSGTGTADVCIYYCKYILDDQANLSFTDGAGNDLPFSCIALANPTNSVYNRQLISKINATSGAEQIEYNLGFDSNLFTMRLRNSNNMTNYIGRYYATSLTTDVGSYHSYIGTYNGNKSVTGIKLYRDGNKVDDTNTVGGTYTGMTATNAKVGNYNIGADGKISTYSDVRFAVTAIIAEELSTEQVKQIDVILRAYVGIDVVAVTKPTIQTTFSRLRQQQVCNELSKIVTDKNNIKRLIFFDENGETSILKDRTNNGNAYLSANASSLNPDIEGEARTLNFINNNTWELDSWQEYDASYGYTPQSSLAKYVWSKTTNGTITEIIDNSKLNLSSLTGDNNYVKYSRDTNLVNVNKTKAMALKAVFNQSADSGSRFYLRIADGTKCATVYVEKFGGSIKYQDSSAFYQQLSTGNMVESDFILQINFNNVDGLKVYFNGVQQGATIPYNNLLNSSSNYVQFSAENNSSFESFNQSIYYCRYTLDVYDTNNLSFTDGTNDLPFSLVACVNPNITLNSTLLAKKDITTNAIREEYNFVLDYNNKLRFGLYTYDANGIETGKIERYYNTSLISDINSYHSYISTYDGLKSSSGLCIYRDGLRVDDTNASSGTYTGMSFTNTKVGNYRISATGIKEQFGSYKASVIAIISEELTADQVKAIDAILRSYVGIDAVTL